MPTILIVDDSGFQRTSLRRSLAGSGRSVLEAANGEQALTIAGARDLDAILTDLIMPNMRGLALLAALAEQGSEVPVVVLTADIQQRTVLVVDDEEAVRSVARCVLEDSGFTVTTAADGDEGVEVFRRHADDIAPGLLDDDAAALGPEDPAPAATAARRGDGDSLERL